MHIRSLSVVVCALTLVGSAIGCGDDETGDGTSSGSTTGTPGGTGGTGATGGTGSGGEGGTGSGGEGGMGTGGMATGGMGGNGTGGMGGMGSGGMGGNGTGGMGGMGNKMLNGCDPATATDLTGGQDVKIDFPGIAFSYAPNCIKVSEGTKVNFVAGAGSSFASHPLVGGTVDLATKTPDPQSPIQLTNTGTSKEFTMSNAGDYGYYCDFHALAGMKGAIFVVP